MRPTPVSAPPPHSVGRTGDYFDTLSSWLDSPDLAFASWLQRQGYKDSTQTVYRSMWGSLLAWVGERGIAFSDLEFYHLAAFLDKHSLYKAHRARYLRIVERAFDHLSHLGFSGQNPGRKAAREKIGAGENDDTRFLTVEERGAVIARIETGIEKIRKGKTGKEEWLEVRDYALVGAMVGAGLKVGQVQAVTVNCIKGKEADSGEFFVEVPPRRGVDKAHRAKVMPFALDILVEWNELRLGQEGGASKGMLLFPTERRRDAPRLRKAAPLHAASVFRRARAFLGLCGVAGDRACPQTLRNTYAAILIDAGASDTELIDNLGLVAGRSVERLRASYKQFQTRQGAGVELTPSAPAAPRSNRPF